MRQVTLLNLGRHFSIKKEDWPLLCNRIEDILGGQACLKLPISDVIEKAAQRYAALLVARSPTTVDTPAAAPTAAPDEAPALLAEPVLAEPVPAKDFQEVDIETLQMLRARSVGVEHVGLHAMEQMGFIKKLGEPGINGKIRSAIVGSVIGRMAKPASELATHTWLQTQSGLGELMEVDFEGLSLSNLYRASDALLKHREVLEDHLFGRARDLLSLKETVTLFDLTNTYFEGDMAGNAKAKRGHSKEKRTDCPLVTLALVLNDSGFVRRSRMFEGNVAECTTLEGMLCALDAPVGALVIMDRGIATKANIAWLVANKYRYLVVNRSTVRQFDESQSVSIENAGGETIRIQKVVSEDQKEVFLYCHSEGREKKETGIVDRFCKGFEAGLRKLAEGLKKPRCEKRIDRLNERIGRLKAKSRGAGQHYEITLTPDESGQKANEITWSKTIKEGTMAANPGVYCLRTNETRWDEERLWRTYSMLTDLESVFRSLKPVLSEVEGSELGLRPVFHSKADRADGHLFITVLAYQFVQFLRVGLKVAGINDSWTSLRAVLEVQRRVTASFQTQDGHTLNIRKSSVAEPELMNIYQAIGINAAPGGTKKMVV
ncbi:MAG: IS1634 family transposase [Sulfuricellaceae bacterium]